MKKSILSALVGIVLLFSLNVIAVLLKVQGKVAYFITAAITIAAVRYTYQYFHRKESGYVAEKKAIVDVSIEEKESKEERIAMIVAYALTGGVVICMVYALFTQF